MLHLATTMLALHFGDHSWSYIHSRLTTVAATSKSWWLYIINVLLVYCCPAAVGAGLCPLDQGPRPLPLHGSAIFQELVLLLVQLENGKKSQHRELEGRLCATHHSLPCFTGQNSKHLDSSGEDAKCTQLWDQEETRVWWKSETLLPPDKCYTEREILFCPVSLNLKSHF